MALCATVTVVIPAPQVSLVDKGFAVDNLCMQDTCSREVAGKAIQYCFEINAGRNSLIDLGIDYVQPNGQHIMDTFFNFPVDVGTKRYILSNSNNMLYAAGTYTIDRVLIENIRAR